MSANFKNGHTTLDKPPNCPPTIYILIQKCLVPDPNMRVFVQDISSALQQTIDEVPLLGSVQQEEETETESGTKHYYAEKSVTNYYDNQNEVEVKGRNEYYM